MISCLLMVPPIVYEQIKSNKLDPATSKKEYKRIKVTYR